ncbi:Hint domain-containing protein [Aliiroseovarius sp. PTFE2010]|uniref:Hint domain-containing protein n=1 Tax=Aliiroseovarius sp. PTFE2010 TaxID=3417190 RepID=UPI003CF5EBC4
MPSFSARQLNDVSFSGSPFASNSLADSSDIGTTFTINSGARPQLIRMSDNESLFSDSDFTQRLDGAHNFNGRSYSNNASIETEYSYVVRPVGGATDGSEDIRIYSIEISGGVQGFVADGFMEAGASFEIVAIHDQSPTVGYSTLYVCFRTGTMIETQQGPRAVQDLAPGDMLWTLDHGYQPLKWVGHERVPGTKKMAPIRIETGVLGNARPLFVSPQHRMLKETAQGQVLVPAVALLDVPGVDQITLPHVDYVHLLLPRHEILMAEGTLAESFNPGPMAWAALPKEARTALGELDAVPTSQRIYPDARPILGAGQWRRLSAGQKTMAPADSQSLAMSG